MAWVYYILLFLFLISGLALTVMTLPGLWLMVAATAIYAWFTHGYFISWWTLAVLLVLATIAEIIEFFSSGAGARKAGGGKAGFWGALLGGIVGGIVLSFFIPIPIFGTLVGVCVGTFVGAMAGELLAGREVGHSAWIGFGAARGRLFGTFIKLGFGCVMLTITMAMGFPVGGSKPKVLPKVATPATVPSTLPATHPAR
ncbi:MAG TPA: DUF456 domain-containing protein [Tepidisphaeraceae bacterium]|jgi:hypothetical protein